MRTTSLTTIISSIYVLALACSGALLPSAFARQLFVDQRIAQDQQLDTPQEGDITFGDLQHAVDSAEPGDMIIIVTGSGPYRNSIMIENSGEADNPIILEGNGETIDIGIDISEGPWTYVDGLWRLESPTISPKTRGLVQRTTAFYQGRFITFHDAANAQTEQPDYSAILDTDGHLQFKFPEGMEPPFERLILPKKPLASAIATKNLSYWRISNLHARHAGNDGFNYHGEGVGLELINCSAFFCGDEGSSAHGSVQIEIIGCLFAYNGSGSGGVVDVNECISAYRNCISAFNRGVGFNMRGKAHSIQDSLSAANAEPETKRTLPPQKVTIENLDQLTYSPNIIDNIQNWKPKHPMLPRLIEAYHDVTSATLVDVNQASD